MSIYNAWRKNALHKEWPHITKQDLKFTNPDQNGEKDHVIFSWFTDLEKKAYIFGKKGVPGNMKKCQKDLFVWEKKKYCQGNKLELDQKYLVKTLLK